MVSNDVPFIRVTYELRCAGDASVVAREIALEQTAELPDSVVSPAVEDQVVGRLEALDPLPDGRWRAVIAYPEAVAGDDVPQLLNLLFGNISMKEGIRIAAVEWPATLLAQQPGPQFGIDGVRALCGLQQRRPLLCAALKPVGFTAEQLAALCYQFALGGVDLIKDDHGLANQVSAPFAERLERCQDAVTRANANTGGHSLYLPNTTAGFKELPGRIEAARAAGCRAALLSPLLTGVDVMRWAAETSGLALLAHPSLTGTFFAAEHGIAPEVLLGDLFRMLGADGVIYPNAGGRFPITEGTCAAINDRLRRPLGDLRPAFPAPGGGVTVARVPYWIERYGPDTIFLIGGSLYAQPDIRAAARELIEMMENFNG